MLFLTKLVGNMVGITHTYTHMMPGKIVLSNSQECLGITWGKLCVWLVSLVLYYGALEGEGGGWQGVVIFCGYNWKQGGPLLQWVQRPSYLEDQVSGKCLPPS